LDTGLRVVGLLFVHLSLLHALLKLLLRLFVLFFGLLHGLLHLLQGQLFLLLSLIAVVIGCEASPAGNVRRRLGELQATGPLAGAISKWPCPSSELLPTPAASPSTAGPPRWVNADPSTRAPAAQEKKSSTPKTQQNNQASSSASTP
jgi:hypothetical protein